MAFGDPKFLFAKVDYGLGCFPIIFRCWTSFVELGIYFSQFE
jgi:hypothetical protein